MSDAFNFGSPAKRPAKLGTVQGRRVTAAFDARILLLSVGLILTAIVVFVVLRATGEAGSQVAGARSETMLAIDRASDAAAQGTLASAAVVAQTAWAEQGTFPSDPAALAAFDPSVRFTGGASTGPTSIAMSAEDAAFAAAVRSDSGTCWWVRLDAAGATTYGSGDTCTGQAAMSADAPTW